MNIKRIVQWVIGLSIGLILTMFLLVRFTNVHFQAGDKIILAYDEDYKELLFLKGKKYSLNGADGPYIIDNKLYQVTENSELVQRAMNRKEAFKIIVSGPDRDSFEVSLKENLLVEPSEYDAPEKLIAISDIEGNFDAFAGFLIKHQVIDHEFHWIFGKGHLVLPGDMVDRGENVTQVLWLIYKLENEAVTQGGKVHYLIGNHEILNFQGDAEHNQDKYKKAAMLISQKDKLKKAVAYMYSDATELGKWLRTKNVVERIGDILFTHGGLSPDFLDYQVSLSEMNEIARKNWDLTEAPKGKEAKLEKLIVGDKGPYLYRGLIKNYKDYDKISSNKLDELLLRFKAKKIAVGHTVVKNVDTEFKGKVIAMDVRHGEGKFSHKTQGIYCEKGIIYVVDAKGDRKKI